MPPEMGQLQRLGWLTGLLLGLRIADLTVIVAGGIVAFWLRHGLIPLPQDELVAIGLGGMFCLIIFNSGRAYRSNDIDAPYSLCCRALGYWALASLFLLTSGFMLKISDQFSRLWAVSWFALTAVGLTVSRLVVGRIIVHARHNGQLALRVAIIGADALGTQLYHHLQARADYVRVVGVFDDRIDRLGGTTTQDGIQISGKVADVVPLVTNGQVESVIIALPWTSEQRLNQLVNTLQGLAVDIQICPEGLGFAIHSFPTFGASFTTSVGGLPMFTIRRRPLGGWNWLIKRIEDKVLASLMLLLLLPLFLIIALAIRLDSPGPALFRQMRRGFNGRNFQIIKFRTMRVETGQQEGHIDAARRIDSRVTGVGHFLRRTSLDELPQLLNVLRGEMSIIGPRPHALSHDLQFSKLIGEYYARNMVLPGITGWAQINGLRGSIEDEKQIRERVEHDLWYIEHWSILLDLRILLMTIFVGLVHRNAY